jgi:hypothetical protein
MIHLGCLVSRIVKGCLEFLGDLFVAPSLEKEIFDNKSLFDMVRDWLLTSTDDAIERFSMIRASDIYDFGLCFVM